VDVLRQSQAARTCSSTRLRSRRTLKEKVIPFFEKYMIFSAKRDVFLRFKEIVEAMEDRKEHLTPEGLVRIVEQAYAMNPASKGKERKRPLHEVVERILRGRTLDTPQE
jgi:hypothetical protein